MRSLSLGVISLRLLWWGALFVSFSSLAQRQKLAPKARTGSSIVDDTTRNVYGPSTTRWTTEKDLFQNRPNYRPLDTAVNNYHRWTYVQRSNNYYKDLGVMGTALSPIFPLVPSVIGATAGFQTYEPYFATQEPRYWDTKSPFTRMAVVWGGKGRAMTHIEFSRNINKRWNFGFNYRPILVEKMIQREPKTNRQVVSHYYDFFTTFKSKNDRYFLLFNFRRIRHHVLENGGVLVKDPANPNDSFFAPDAQPNLIGAHSEEYRRNIHLFHQYQLVKAFQIYHIADFTKQTNSFTDDLNKDSKALFSVNEKVGLDSTKSNDQTTFITMQQEVGIKGNVSKLFYSAYFKLRTFNYSNPYLDSIAVNAQTSGTESYLGGSLSLQLDSLSEISGTAEYLLGGFYRVEGQIQTPWLEGYFKNSLSKPGLMQMAYLGSHDSWNKKFDGINSTQAQGFLKFKAGVFQMKAGATFTLLHNTVYFKAVPTSWVPYAVGVSSFQSSGNQSTISPEVRLSVQFFNHIYFRPQVIYTAFITNDDNVLQIPQVFVNSQLAYENLLFKNHLQVQAGIDAHWHSDYNALGYDLTIQQFYVQTTTISPSFPLVDIFFTGKMRRARFFFKYHNLMQAFQVNGYLPTPGYPGQRNIIDFGFDFLLFD